jgi:hypothetical protein
MYRNDPDGGPDANKMWIVLCDENDPSALWAYEGLRRRNLEPLELITAGDIGNGLRLVYRTGNQLPNVLLQDGHGRSIDSRFVKGGLNRLQGVHPGIIRRFVEEDRLYVQQEFYSALLGWLSALTPNLINRPSPLGLSGQWRHESEWMWFAGRSGLPVRAYRESTSSAPHLSSNSGIVTTVFVVSGQCVGGEVPADLLNGCLQLAQLVDTRLLGIDFIQDNGAWWFAGASPMPDLRTGGEPLLDCLSAVLRQELPS